VENFSTFCGNASTADKIAKQEKGPKGQIVLSEKVENTL